MSPQNRAAWLKEKQSPQLVVDVSPFPEPNAEELIVQTKAVAFNPVDGAMQSLGIIVQNYPAILGMDIAGIVHSVGSGEISKSFKPGDHVIGMGNPFPVGPAWRDAAFQEYVVLRSSMIAKLPDHVDFKDAAVLPLCFGTAVSVLFDPDTLGLERPLTGKGKGKTLLIWGASSSVGCNAVQLAVAAGYEVLAVASRKNHDLVKGLGAGQCFDQSDASVVDDLVAACQEKDCVGALDSIGTQSIIDSLCQVLRRVQGRKKISCVQFAYDSPDNGGVEIVSNLKQSPNAFGGELGRWFWREFLDPALAKGEYQYKPNPEVVGHGLEAIQTGLDTIRKGVSARKVVVTL